jgi:hypothetical protein
MKIWLDLRFINDDLYSSFVIELVKWIISKSNENEFIIYANINIQWFEFNNCTIRNINIKNNSLKEQTTFNKILKKDKNALMLFFNHYKPVFYKWEYYTLVASLKDIYYNNFSNYFHKYLFLYLLEKNLKNSRKIICFDKNTTNELVEKFNIKEENIELINWFFPNKDILTNIEDLKIDIKTKYDLKNPFYIYSWWEGLEKNYEKLVSVFKRLKNDWLDIDLVLLWKNIARNIPLRKLILENNMQKNIHFVSIIKQNEKILFYKNSIWVIFPSFYEPFPFRLTEPIYYKTPILSSDLKNIKSIFNDTIKYFSPISVNSIYEAIKSDIINPRKTTHYNEIIIKYSKEKTIAQLLDIIN